MLNQEEREFMRKWVAALRSDEYEQTQKTLCAYDGESPIGYCCLGVATHILNPDHSALRRYKRGYSKNQSISNEQFVPIDIVNRFPGIFHTVGDIHIPTEKMTEAELHLCACHQADTINLSALNDAGFSFEMIANLLERLYLQNDD